MKRSVSTEAGVVEGVDGGVKIFRGIPYARPPVGDLRWNPPLCAEGWTGVRSAESFGMDCPQIPLPTEPSNGPGMDEDCLYINVWTPAQSASERLPVMVWIHGGGFLSGSGADIRCDGEHLAGRGVVVVTFNYRLGIFGYLAHPRLSRESESGSSGNYGLMDQIAALEWVARNIEAFGGDPSRVTVFGVSAGSASIAQLITCEKARGLFSRAILESAGAFRPLCTLQEAEHAGSKLGDDVGALRTLSADALFARTKDITSQMRGLTTPRALRPIRDGVLIREDDRDAYRAGRVLPVSIIVGSNGDEGTIFTSSWPVKTVAEYAQFVRENFPDFADEAMEAYPAKSDSEVPAAVAAMFADCQFNFGARGIAAAFAEHHPPAYRYLFTRPWGTLATHANHGDEVAYVFGTIDSYRHLNNVQLQDRDSILSNTMMQAWIAFASDGNPNDGSLLDWKPYNRASDQCLEFGDTIGTVSAWRARQLDLLERFFDSRLKASA
jgi:para-nitrobenzyl esterase